MICPHCAFPNNPGARVCRKCKRPLGDEAGSPSSPAILSADPVAPMSDDLPTPSDEDNRAVAGQPAGILDRVSACLADARLKEKNGDLRGAFLVCQSLLIDLYGDIPKEALASLYGYMGRVSRLQGKSERAKKYMRKAESLTGRPPTQHRAAPSSSIEKAISRAVEDAAGGREEQSPNVVQETQQEPSAQQSPAEPAAAPVGDGKLVRVAGFWTRLAALALDSLIVGAVVVTMMLMSSLLQGDGAAGAFSFFTQKLSLVMAAFLIYIGFLLVYLTLFSAYGGQSAGKMLLRIRVVQLDGHSLTTSRALRRAGGMLIAALPGLAGFFWAAFDLERRGWHDYIGGTLVVRLSRQDTPAQAIT